MKGIHVKGTKSQKKPYVKPEVKQVQLRPDEAVLGACKNASQYGPTIMGCKPLGNCSGMGS